MNISLFISYILVVNNMDIEKIKRRIRNKNSSNKSSWIKRLLIKTMVLTVIFLITLILIKSNDKNKEWINKNILSKNISFAGIKSIYTKYLGSVLPFESYLNVEPVFNEKLIYSDINKYKDGVSLTVTKNYLVPIQYSGIVVFIGDKEGYGNTVIIESDNVTMWYCNINNPSVKLYDYVEGGKYLGETIDNKLYLLFEENGEIVDYKKYI